MYGFTAKLSVATTVSLINKNPNTIKMEKEVLRTAIRVDEKWAEPIYYVLNSEKCVMYVRL